ncbi:hypothetical protein Pint_25397 [Pistacia integerrima]|uniref:Uncharacterized protein n=1 Tax=Pistacia integerrima TaxID=434235 RepID=A0ACC0YHK6_9ROSI|nr:hypothetical protein Pint_25397 [Pistacia integerrima]
MEANNEDKEESDIESDSTPIVRFLIEGSNIADHSGINGLGRVVGMTNQEVNCVVRELRVGNEFFASFVYVVNDLIGRRELWENLRNRKCVVGNSLWILMGYFNATLYLNESLGGLNIITTAMKEFRDHVDELEIEHIS